MFVGKEVDVRVVGFATNFLVCSGGGGEMNRALDFSGMCLPSNSLISRS